MRDEAGNVFSSDTTGAVPQDRTWLARRAGHTKASPGEVNPLNFTAPFRCVHSVSPSADPGRATVVADQSDPWLLGGPD